MKKLMEMAKKTKTVLWNDSCSVSDLSSSIKLNGAVGATCNPVIVMEVLKKELNFWKDRIPKIIDELPEGTEGDVGWRLVEEMSIKAAKLLEPVFGARKGRDGRLSIQTDPRLFRNPEKMVEQAVHFSSLAPNMIVKIPVTSAGVEAIEEATFRGVSINATVSFSVPQAVAVAEAVERGLKRREKEGLDISSMGPVCTIMVGRVDDWLKSVANRDDIICDPGIFEWAGVAVMKKAYSIYRERKYRLRLLSAAFRNHMHWSEFIGGDVVISPPYKWQERYNGSSVRVEDRIDTPVDPAIVSDLQENFVDFRKAFEEDGMKVKDFDTFGPTLRTLRQFCGACSELESFIRDILVPNPDK